MKTYLLKEWKNKSMPLEFPVHGKLFDSGKSSRGIGKRNMTTPIIISVLIGITLITLSGYFLWKICSNQKGFSYWDEREFSWER